MSLTQYFWGAIIDLMENIGALEDYDTLEVKKTDSSSTHSLSPADLQPTSEQHYSPDRKHTGTAAWIKPHRSHTIQDSESKEVNAEDVTISEDSGLKSNEDTDFSDQNAELHQESSGVCIRKDAAKFNTYSIDQDLSGQNQMLQQDNARHLRWQDNASMYIKTMKEEAEDGKHKARAARKAAVRARAAVQQQIDDYKRKIEKSEQDNVRVSDENARTIEAHQSSLQEAKDELETQKEAAEQAATAAERRITEEQTKHTEDMSTAESKIEELRATQTFTFDCQWESNGLRQQLSQAKKEKAEESVAKDEEIKTLRSCIADRDSEILRVRDEAEVDRKAKMEAIREKNGLYRAKLEADREVKRLKEENESLESKREKAASRALGAEGRAKGLQDQLVVTKKRAEQWETLYNQTEENARNEVLSAYTVATAQVSEEDQQTTKTSSEEERLSVLVENLRGENVELQKKNDCLTADIEEWNRAWEMAVKNQKTWEKDMRLHHETDKQEALATANVRATNGQDAREQDVRRECEEEKLKALAAEREKCRVQWASQKCSLSGESSAKPPSYATKKLQTLHRTAGIERRKELKVKKGPMKWVFDQAVLRAVEVERSLLQEQFRAQFQAELSSYKTQAGSEHTRSQTQSDGQNDTGPINQILLHEEVKKRDGYIQKHKKDLKTALEAKQESEEALKNVKEENQRLSQDVMTYESQKAMVRQTKSETQITLMAQELGRAITLFTEIALLGLDEKHRNFLNELVLANRVVTDLRTTIEDGDSIDYEEFQDRLDRVFASFDASDALDPKKRPVLHAQLFGTYSVIGGLINIFADERGETAQQEILERIYRDSDKGKGKQGAIIGSGAASGPSVGAKGGVNASPLPQPNGNNPFTSGPNDNLQTGFSNTSTPQSTPNPTATPFTTTPQSTPNPTATPFTTTPKPDAPESQNEPKYTDSATAHALQGKDETDQGTSDPFDLDSFDPDSFDPDSIDWSDPTWQDFNPDLPWPTFDP